MRVRTSIGLMLLAALFCNILYSQAFAETRVYCFAMFSSATRYHIEVIVDGRPLAPAEVEQRYGYRASGFETRSIQHVKNVIAAVEAKATDRAHVSLIYSTDGGPQQQWTVP